MGTTEEAETLLGESPASAEEKIVVSVRLRPLNEKENSRNDVSDWECLNHNMILYRNNLSPSDRSLYPPTYTFDRVFGPECSTATVYVEGAKEVALSVVDGINSSVFAYGQTSSGKTYTMSGITEYTVADIYDHIEKHHEREFVLKLSAIEIYNESVRDLLSSDPTPLRLLDDPERGTVVEKLTEETVADWNHFKELISLCEAQRQIGETNLNEASSRSHQILRLVVESSTREPSSSVLAASVNFVDLAGSERASQSLSAGTRLKEGCHINRSLLTLGTVIRKLSKGRSHHIPFRDSKLTRILQSTLGGNSRTAIICTMSPARVHVEQSRNTLLFASCAKEITTNAKVNVVVSDKALVKHLQRELARLESQLRSSALSSSSYDFTRLMTEKDLQIEKLNKHVEELTLQLGDAMTQIQALAKSPEFEACKVTQANYPSLRVRESWESECSYSTDSAVICDASTRTFTEASEEETADEAIPSPRVSVGSVSYVDCNDVRDEQDDSSVDSYVPYREELESVEVRESCVTDTNGDVSAVPAKDEPLQQQVDEPKPQRLRYPLCDKVSPLFTEDACFSSRSLMMNRSRSCKGRIMESYGDYWFEIETPRFEFGLSQRRAIKGRPPKNSMWDLVTDTSVPENSNESSVIIEANTLTGSTGYSENPENGNEKYEGGAAVVLQWPSEFKKLRQEIIDLWDKCNVSLVHRSYFFLLFNGDASDSLYVEVEHRRLSFLRDTISRGAKTFVNGHEFTLSSSKKALVKERYMLSRRMSRNMGAEERIDAFVKWGIELSSNKRRLQLAHRVWTDTSDIEHVAESADLVAKLVVLKESHQTLREMFGLLNFSPKRPTWRRSSLWRH